MFTITKFVVSFAFFSILSTTALEWAGVPKVTVWTSTVVALPHMGLGIVLYHYVFRRFVKERN